MENNWQPARLVHNCRTRTADPLYLELGLKTIVRVRPISGKCPCGGSRYQIHPDDGEKINPDVIGMTIVACEKDVLTD